MHVTIESILAAAQQALATMAMMAAWTPTKFDDQLVRILQVTLRHTELTDLIIELFDQHTEPILSGVPRLNLNAAGDTPLKEMVEGELLDQHNQLITTVKARLEGRAGPSDDLVVKAKEVLAREKIDWQKWVSYLPTILSILAMFMKK